MNAAVQFIDTHAELAAPTTSAKPIVVAKFGSSVLQTPDDIPEVVSEIYRIVRQGRQVVAVVSAFAGITDRLLAEAEAAGAPHDNVNAPAYVALGEETSVSLLALACDRAGLCAIGLKSAELGILAEGDSMDAAPIGFKSKNIMRALDAHDVVIVPGFVASDCKGRTVLLGRGGSDLTAVFLGDKLGAERVRLAKDVDGVYEADPAIKASARRFARVDWNSARAVAGQLIQPKAIDFAAARHLTVELGCLGAADATIIDDEPNVPALPRSKRRLRVALAGLGVVGGGVAQRLQRAAGQYEIVCALLRDPTKPRDFQWEDIPLTVDPDELLEVQPDVIVDVLSDGALGAKLSLQALTGGIHVVSANKQAIAASYEELHAAARMSDSRLIYSAAVGGGAPILEAVKLACEAESDIHTIEGVLNGTVNFVLGLLSNGADLNDALKAARKAGLAEEDASMDLNGGDALAKLKLIALEAFSERLSVEQLHVEALTPALASLARRTPLKQIARITQRGGRLRGEIVFEPAHHGAFAELGGDRNALFIKGDDGRAWSARGRGAGRWPTAESVLADLADIYATLA
jgi:homoserine dehydrogenase